MKNALFTVGHSTHTLDRFLALLEAHGITAVCDVRSSPYSRLNPQFNREALKGALRQRGISYTFLGKELGARSRDPECYVNGRVQYDRLAQTALFQSGLERIIDGMRSYRVALTCAEKDPLMCHRCILVARHLESRGVHVEHILEDGMLESQKEVIARLLKQLGLPEEDMFRSRDEVVVEAYRIQGERIAYEEETDARHSDQASKE